MERISRQRVLSVRLDCASQPRSSPARIVLIALPAILLFVSSPASPVDADAVSENPTKLLQKTFANQYDVDSTATIELVIRNRSGQERRRNFEAASKIIEDRLHSIGRLTYPAYLRGMTILQIEAQDRSHDAFIYLPSTQTVRRISTAQRGDAFFGTDVTYEDLERRYARDYDIIDLSTELIGGERTHVVRAHPQLRQTYHEVVFWLAQSDQVILQAHYFKRGAQEPYRTIEAPRSSMQKTNDHTLPTRLIVENLARGTTTEVTYRQLAINPEIDDRVFSVRTLEQKGPIPASR